MLIDVASDAPRVASAASVLGGRGTEAQVWCDGCLHHPHPDCAACGRPATVALDAGVGVAGARCSMSLCASCHAVVLDYRRERGATKRLRYVALRGSGAQVQQRRRRTA